MEAEDILELAPRTGIEFALVGVAERSFGVAHQPVEPAPVGMLAKLSQFLVINFQIGADDRGSIPT